ncbi:MAG TPA: GNAT family N-acetyltransferase [Allosphingosinicella sp.]|uniref:GNAT family N-acetyltransferase n=1 Tax=Allosphingosinicella sp. TaxID=2823234 RepID=UPI002EDAB3B4
MSESLEFRPVEGDEVHAFADTLADLCAAAFHSFDGSYLLNRLPGLSGVAAVVALEKGAPIAFKLGYRRGHDLFYSWLGAVHPLWRRKGVARRLMEAQHRWANEQGYRFVETRTRASNTPMIILNLSAGFVISGYEVDRAGHPVVTQRRNLSAGPVL